MDVWEIYASQHFWVICVPRSYIKIKVRKSQDDKRFIFHVNSSLWSQKQK